VLLAVNSSAAPRRLHHRTLGRPAKVHGHVSGIPDKTGDDRLGLRVITAQPLHDLLGVRSFPAAAAWNEAVSVMNDFV
jgi:hypothetical protein